MCIDRGSWILCPSLLDPIPKPASEPNPHPACPTRGLPWLPGCQPVLPGLRSCTWTQTHHPGALPLPSLLPARLPASALDPYTLVSSPPQLSQVTSCPLLLSESLHGSARQPPSTPPSPTALPVLMLCTHTHSCLGMATLLPLPQRSSWSFPLLPLGLCSHTTSLTTLSEALARPHTYQAIHLQRRISPHGSRTFVCSLLSPMTGTW